MIQPRIDTDLTDYADQTVKRIEKQDLRKLVPTFYVGMPEFGALRQFRTRSVQFMGSHAKRGNQPKQPPAPLF